MQKLLANVIGLQKLTNGKKKLDLESLQKWEMDIVSKQNIMIDSYC